MKTLYNPSDDTNIVRVRNALEEKMQRHFRNLRHNVSKAQPWNGIQAALLDTIVYAGQEAYRTGALEVGRTPLSSDYLILHREGVARAEWVASEMKGWTERSLQASKKSKLLSKQRANKVSIFESRKAAFSGKLKGWGRNKLSKKSWFTSDAHDTDDVCDDNEDDGIIDMGDVFTSGDPAPPAHLFCECSLWLHR